MTTDRAAWLEERKKGIGGSDVAGILGLSKWSTPYSIYADKRGESEQTETNVDMLIGTMVEPWLFDEYKRVTGLDVQKVPNILYDAEYPFLLANVDGLLDDRVVEFKTARDDSEWGDPGTDQCPASYVLQCQHYMRVADRPMCDLGVLFKNSRTPEIVLYRIERDDDLLALIVPKLVEFWRCVQEGIAPAAVSSSDATWKYKKSEPIAVEADTSVAGCVAELKRIKAEISMLESKQDAYEARIKEYMQNADTLKAGSKVLATWKKSRDSQMIDADKLRAEMPDIVKAYSKPKAGLRKFLLK